MEGELPTRARIVIADDHPLFRFALVALLRECPDFEVIGEATDGQEALKLCSRLKPDLVLMDVIMPRMGGIEAARAIKRELPKTIVLMMTASVEPPGRGDQGRGRRIHPEISMPSRDSQRGSQGVGGRVPVER